MTTNIRLVGNTIRYGDEDRVRYKILVMESDICSEQLGISNCESRQNRRQGGKGNKRVFTRFHEQSKLQNTGGPLIPLIGFYGLKNNPGLISNKSAITTIGWNNIITTNIKNNYEEEADPTPTPPRRSR